ncbi:hypothetical protein Bca52824_081122 [Brassica carinata]|uniref:F-box associated beta-propeller type 3 domain-containing protein n=1 Tax=Brassica carinata TaxID=52824 RepID=A0A8X7TSX3_BRACI|nr:hypothetical protein Bca52824_081122 [Brassica carinata]
MIQVPRRDGDEVLLRMKNVSLIEYGGKVTIIDQTNLREKGMLDLWAVEDAGNKNSWSRKTMHALEVVAQPWILALGEVDPALLARALGVKHAFSFSLLFVKDGLPV